jgi:iron complex transport system ATP-binding protein
MSDICFELKNVSAGYEGDGSDEDKNILHDISFSVQAGRNVCILGENGCGKTTLLHTMIGLLKYSGSICIGDRELREMKRRETASKVSLMAQFSDTFFSYTVYETVMLGRYLHSEYSWQRRSGADREAVMKCLEATNLLEIKDRKITELSGGQLQRVYLARTFAQDAPVILLDEPTNHLDLKHQQELISYLKKWSCEDGHTVIGVFHDISLAAEIADDIIFMKDGRIAAQGDKESMLSAELLHRVYDFDVASYMRKNLAGWQNVN